MSVKELIICAFIVFITKVRSQESSLSYNYYENNYHKENITYDATSDLKWNCELFCSNGLCSPNNDCICFESFEIYPPGSNTCVPKCDVRYERVDGDCRPHCSKPCAPGTCTAPERCSCDFGWTKNVLGECISTCHPECGFGTCVGWNKCNCWASFEWRKDGDPQCVKQELVQNLTTYFETPSKNKSADNTSSLNFLYAACALNVILLIIVTIILVKNPGILKCVKLRKHSINTSNNTIECNEQGYVVMHSHNSGNSRSSNIYSYPYIFPKVIRDKVIRKGSSIRASPQYDCVQM